MDGMTLIVGIIIALSLFAFAFVALKVAFFLVVDGGRTVAVFREEGSGCREMLRGELRHGQTTESLYRGHGVHMVGRADGSITLKPKSMVAL